MAKSKYTTIAISIQQAKLVLKGLTLSGLGIDERVHEKAQLHVALREAVNAFNPLKHGGINLKVTAAHQKLMAHANILAQRAEAA
ncbi:hypothetical protein [Burkholderia phage BCSR5]|nr:hypothetical protein [Burkholderia phage BCSR5]